ncbi:MAG: GNAT family N-acetyltransferase [Cyclobacteriaceae bacterium]
MIDSYEVSHTAKEDLAVIYELFDHSIKYQEKRGFPVWKNYDRSAIVRDIEEKNQYKVVVEGQIAIVFSVCYTDRVIWREREKGDAIYLHRIVVNPAFKGQQLFGAILQWAIQHGNEKGLKFVRMDTWAANPNIVEYYKRFGFKFIENFTTPDTMELPVHNRNLPLTLLEYKI